MIIITIPPKFEAERSYALHVLLRVVLGLDFTIQVSDEASHYIITYEGNEIRIADAFFGTIPDTYLQNESLPQSPVVAQSAELGGAVILYGQDAFSIEDGEPAKVRLHCGVDLIAGAFFMLTRWEESVQPERDRHDRFPAKASVAFLYGFLDRPIVNEYAGLLKNWLIRVGLPERAFKNHAFRLRLQCDVDMALHWTSPFSMFRKTGFRLFKERSAGKAVRQFGQYLRYLKNGHDPYDTYDYIMDVAEEAGSKACFLFPVGGKHRFDNTQLLHDKHVLNFFQHIRMRGHDTGVHYSYLTPDDPALFVEETKQYRKYDPAGMLRARQHILRCHVPDTWSAWEQAGVEEDYTMGYADLPGFRCGICQPFPLFDVRRRTMLQVTEIPLIAMDVTFRAYLHTTPEEAITICCNLMKTVKEHGGDFVLLWHNSSFGMDWEGWDHVIAEVASG